MTYVRSLDKHPSALSNAEVLLQVRELAGGVIAAEAGKVDRDGMWPRTGIQALLVEGLGGLVVSREQGGMGHGLLATAQVCEMIGRECASTALCFGMHLVGSAVISAKATPGQQQQFLDPINQGRHLTTLALSEAGTGSHFYLPQTQLQEATRDQFRIKGKKSFVTNGGHADSYVVSTVAAEPDAPPGQFSCVLVPAEAPGVSWGPVWKGLGMHGNSSLIMNLHDVLIPHNHLLGDSGDQIWYVFEVIAPYFLMAMAGTYLGVASTALDEARSHLVARRHEHSGVPLSRQPVLQHRVGQLWAELERTRQLIYAAAAQGDRQVPDALPSILSAKAEVADCVVHIVNEAMTLVGGIGYQEDGRLGRCLRDARAAHVMSPTTELLRIWTGRALLDLPLLGD